MESIADRRSLRVIYVNRGVASTECNGCAPRQIFAHTRLVRACVKSLKNTPNFSWEFLISAYVEAPALSRVVTLFLSRREGERCQKEALLLRCRLTLKIP